MLILQSKLALLEEPSPPDAPASEDTPIDTGTNTDTPPSAVEVTPNTTNSSSVHELQHEHKHENEHVPHKHEQPDQHDIITEHENTREIKEPPTKQVWKMVRNLVSHNLVVFFLAIVKMVI